MLYEQEESHPEAAGGRYAVSVPFAALAESVVWLLQVADESAVRDEQSGCSRCEMWFVKVAEEALT